MIRRVADDKELCFYIFVVWKKFREVLYRNRLFCWFRKSGEEEGKGVVV